MKATDFRIGNLIEYCRVSEKSIDILDLKLISEGEDREDIYKPIAITEERLLELGFEIRIEVETQKYFRKNTIEIVYDELDNCYCFKRSLLHFTDIKYVHQLQNLYFALTQTELTAK